LKTPLISTLATITIGINALPSWGEDTCGSIYVNQALVHYIRPETRRHAVPIVAVPGLNLSSYLFVTTPDGREGWAQRFARRGFDFFVINDPNFDFSRGFSVGPFTVPTQGAPPADPVATQRWNRDVWPRWGFGSSEGNPYPDVRFPTAQFSIFKANYPYVSDAGRNYSDAIVALLEMTGPALLMGHSAGGPAAVNAARARPDLVKGFIMIEPTDPPDASDFPVFAGKSMLGVYADYIDSRGQTSRKAATEAAALLFAQNGGVGDVISLPDDLGIHGNTHMMMQDNNNDFGADLISDWLETHVDTQLLPARISIRSVAGEVVLGSPFAGYWQSTTNLIDWTPLSSVKTNEFTVPLESGCRLYRQVN
jgi:pimeloyl-ACP methyl ester carboxylesterase